MFIIEIAFIITVIIIILLNIVCYLAYKKLSDISNESNLTGFEIAKKITDLVTKREPHIIKKNGLFLDHYNTKRNVLKLSPEVFDGTNMYAGFMALGVAFLTSDENKKTLSYLNITSFTIILSYLVICLGALTNHINIIYLGMLLFVLTFLITSVLLNFKNNALEQYYQTIEANSLIKPFALKEKKYFGLFNIIILGSLPYSFINNFR